MSQAPGKDVITAEMSKYGGKTMIEWMCLIYNLAWRQVPDDFFFFFFFSISLTVSTSRLMETQMDLPRQLFGVGFQIFIVTPQMFMFSREYVENVRD